MDQRSHGHSPDGDWTLSYRLMADDTAALIRQLGLGPIDVVGISDGGNIALLLARDHPDLVRRIVISGANLRSGLTPRQAQEQHTLPADALAAKLKKVEEAVPQNVRPDYARVGPDVIYRDLPHAQPMIVPGCNHGTFLNRPKLVNLAVREFLDPPNEPAPGHR